MSISRVRVPTFTVMAVLVGTSAFMTPTRLAISPSTAGRASNSLFVSKASETEDPSPTTIANGAFDPQESKRVAVEALNKLLARQKAEIQETQLLLERLEDSEEDPDDIPVKPLSVAASFLSGVDYGFISRSEGARSQLKGGTSSALANVQDDYGPPANVWTLGTQQFWRNWDAIQGEYRDEEDVELSPTQRQLQKKLKQLTLNTTAIWERELADGPIEAPFVIKIPYLILCWFLDVVFEGRYVPARFFLLETVARQPYFSYMSMLTLYETLGFWRRSADIKRIHFAEEMNEYRHLLIMESLGGDQKWWVRFLAQHSAIVYYIVLCILWALSPTLSYKFSELLETHAVNTYSQLIDENEELLKTLPPSLPAVEYYCLGASDPFYAEFQTSSIERGVEPRRPGENMRSLYDVFSAIRDDEGDHVSAMEACLDPTVAKNSPSLERKVLAGVAAVAAFAFFMGTGQVAEAPVEALEDGASATSFVEGLAAGLTGLAGFKEVVEGEEEEVLGAGTELLEGGVLFNAARQALVQAARTIAAFFAAL